MGIARVPKAFLYYFETADRQILTTNKTMTTPKDTPEQSQPASEDEAFELEFAFEAASIKVAR